MNPGRPNESNTRIKLIDPQLVKMGWNLADRSSVGLEIPVDGYDASPQNGITDYCLYRANGEVLAVVEEKETSRDARVGNGDSAQIDHLIPLQTDHLKLLA